MHCHTVYEVLKTYVYCNLSALKTELNCNFTQNRTKVQKSIPHIPSEGTSSFIWVTAKEDCAVNLRGVASRR